MFAELFGLRPWEMGRFTAGELDRLAAYTRERTNEGAR